MSKQDEIKAVFCPYCGKDMYRHINSFFNKQVGIANKILFDWRCPDCVYTYPEAWLKNDSLNFFKDLMFEYGADKKDIKEIAKVRDLNSTQIKKSGKYFVYWLREFNQEQIRLREMYKSKKAKEVINEFELKPKDELTIGGETKTVAEWDKQVVDVDSQKIQNQIQSNSVQDDRWDLDDQLKIGISQGDSQSQSVADSAHASILVKTSDDLRVKQNLTNPVLRRKDDAVSRIDGSLVSPQEIKEDICSVVSVVGNPSIDSSLIPRPVGIEVVPTGSAF